MNITVTKPNSFDENQTLLSALFNETRNIYSSNSTDQDAEQRLNEIAREFSSFNNEKGREGIIYTAKGISIIHFKRHTKSDDPQEKIYHLELAHDTINDAITQARKIKKLQPSLLKHQIAIKSDLAEVLHTTSDHYNANLLENSAGQVAAELKELFPDYGEGFLTAVSASYKRLKWMMGKMLFDLRRTETLLKKPVHTKHTASQEEVQQYLQDIDRMRTTLNSIYQVIN